MSVAKDWERGGLTENFGNLLKQQEKNCYFPFPKVSEAKQGVIFYPTPTEAGGSSPIPLTLDSDQAQQGTASRGQW